MWHVDKDGNVYISDTLNNRIQIFDADGKFISMFGKAGDAPGTFQRPKGIAIDSDGHIWVVDASQCNVQIYDKDGHLLAFFGYGGGLPGQFGLPAGIAIDKNNRVVVSDQVRGRIQVFRYITDVENAATKAELDKKKASRGPGLSDRYDAARAEDGRGEAMSGTSFVAMWEGTPASVEDGGREMRLPGHSKQLFYPSGGLKTIMKKALFILLAVMFAIGMAAAQDVLGPHNVNGHGCVSCHAPHSGPAGLDPTSANAAQGDVYLWGRNLVAKTYNLFGSSTATPLTMTIPATITDETDPLFHTAACLSCHDGSVTVAGMTGKSLEDVDGKAGITTYLGTTT